MDSIFTPTSTQKHALGRILEADDATGRMWRYCYNGGVALVQGYMTASEAPSANGLNVAQTNYTLSVGDIKFDILLTTGNGYSDNELIDGWLWNNKGSTVLGDQYLIKDNKWTTSDTVMNIEIADQDGIRQAIAATDELSLIKSPYRDVVVMPTTAVAKAVGVPNVAVAINYYFWAQFRGPCVMIADTTSALAAGSPCGFPATLDVAGAVGVMGADTDAIWGTALTVGADAEAVMVDLMLP
jgi:hypothetical protein